MLNSDFMGVSPEWHLLRALSSRLWRHDAGAIRANPRLDYLEPSVDRVQVVGGNFLEGIPPGGDTLLLKTVVHDWDDARAAAILRNCRKMIPSTGKLLIIERELPEIGQPGQAEEAFLLDLEMLVMSPGGRERTRSEFAKLLSDTHFKLVRVVPTVSPVCIFEAQPA
jgi:hypothetical protein